MKLYRVFICFVFLGLLAGAAYSQTDPGVILRGDGASEQVGPTFGGGFQTTNADPFQCATIAADGVTPTGDGSNTNCFESISPVTVIALHLYFAPNPNPLLSLGCGNNSPDPYFQNCVATDGVMFNGISTTEITFSGLGSTDACGGGCPGIQNTNHFLIGLVNADGNSADLTDNYTYSGVADLAVVTPEPASALLFVIGIGAIALFLKRA
jgi:hypothetical protein